MAQNPPTGGAPPPPHILVFPYPSTGHVVPLLDLTHRLLSAGLTATVLVTPPSLPLLQPLLSAHPPPSIQPLVLTPPPTPPRPGARSLPAKILSLQALSGEISSWFRSHPSPPVAIISDFFLGWTHHLALDLHVPRIVFCPSGALGVSVYYSLWKDRPKNSVPGDPNGLTRIERVPGRPVFPWWQLSHVYTGAEEGDQEAEFFRDSMLANMASWGTVVNTVNELESVYIDHLRKEVDLGRVWTVGPLLPTEEEEDWAETRAATPVQDVVLTWLDGRPDRSVVYVCFGSREELSKEQTAALEGALGRCRAQFVWCPGKSGGGVELSSERGLVIRGWAPQLAILRHRAVGAFVTHCGWNSVLEAVAAGVGMVAWPMGADQFADANLVVEELGVAVRVACAASGSDNVPDPDELAQVLDEAVSGTRPQRQRVETVRSLVADSVNEGGSSHGDLANLVACLNQMNLQN